MVLSFNVQIWGKRFAKTKKARELLRGLSFVLAGGKGGT